MPGVDLCGSTYGHFHAIGRFLSVPPGANEQFIVKAGLCLSRIASFVERHA